MWALPMSWVDVDEPGAEEDLTEGRSRWEVVEVGQLLEASQIFYQAVEEMFFSLMIPEVVEQLYLLGLVICLVVEE